MENRACGITEAAMAAYEAYLRREERAEGTVELYLRGVRRFSAWLGEREVTQEQVNQWKGWLVQEGYAPVTVNAMLAALNGFFRFAEWPVRGRFLKIQRRLFRDPGRELTRDEYHRLLAAARAAGRTRLALLLETLCATGIRVSEVQYITVSAARSGRAEVRLKGKVRTILLPERLCHKLLKYAKGRRITHGEIFRTASGAGIGRKQIWAELKSLCGSAGVAAEKVFPHNLRHLFATVFYGAYRDIVHLADVLGHSSIETTRIYLAVSGVESRGKLARLALIE